MTSRKHRELQQEHLALVRQFNDLLEKWNALVQRINDKGGDAFLNGGVSAA